MKTALSSILCLVLLRSCAAYPDTAKLAGFESWYRALNPAFAGLRLATGADQLRPGVVAGEARARGRPLVREPLEQLVTIRTVERSPVGACLGQVRENLDWGIGHEFDAIYYVVLTLYVVHERYVNPASALAPWFNILPSPDDMNNILYWRWQEIVDLQGSPLYERAVARRSEFEQLYEWLQDNIFGGAYPAVFPRGVTKEQFKWATSVVRMFNVQISEDGFRTPALSIAASLFRHCPSTRREASWGFDEDRAELFFDAPADLAPGSEVFMWFGEKCNAELLDFHGFLIDGNENDCVHVDMELNKADPLINEKSLLFNQARLDKSQLKLLRDGVTLEVLRAVRSLTITEDEITPDMLVTGVPNESLGTRSDLLIANYITNLCRNEFSRYADFSEVEAALAERDTPARTRMALTLKKAEREILEAQGRYWFQRTRELKEQFEREFRQQHDEL